MILFICYIKKNWMRKYLQEGYLNHPWSQSIKERQRGNEIEEVEKKTTTTPWGRV